MKRLSSRQLGIGLSVLSVTAIMSYRMLNRPPAPDNIEVDQPTFSAPNDVLSSIEAIVTGYDKEAAIGIQYLDKHWEPGHVVMLLECFQKDLLARRRQPIGELLKAKTGQSFSVYGTDGLFQWLQWVWTQPYKPAADYIQFKQWLYSKRDPSFAAYFDEPIKASIRLDEVVWGGVGQDGIPPLDHPAIVSADEATYLDDSNIVFGIEVDGAARAYPQRVLGHHEMVRDLVGATEVAGVYCTLCGTMIAYDATIGEEQFQLGTSGFLYRSNKLMFDRRTQSLWSTLSGEPVLGELVDQNLRLARIPVVNTTWGQWRKLHPDSTVLAIAPHQELKYAEGNAYADYFATDKIMFPVPSPDARLANKAEVLGLRISGSDERLAISAEFLRNNPVVHETLGTKRFVVLTDAGSGNRVFESGDRQFTSLTETKAIDSHGAEWQVTESGLIGANGVALPRLPAHRAFWFGWHAAFPKTRLLK